MKTQIIGIIILLVLVSCAETKQRDQKSVAELFPPIRVKEWERTPVVNGRLPTKEEIDNGTALLYYPNPGSDVKAYDMKLPKLAYYSYPKSGKKELVVVIQIVQSKQDTVVGYRPLTGLNGASVFSHFQFLTDEEVKELMEKF
ncbi:MAG: hypothetical protein B7X86_08910 [Sphingobacteriales bacterium 17-39-43]|uniref:hypothetical protein n=1 Tax=Daejeonella sp. TaxID=2805397 RepID=UPI000BC6FFC2|nr:hypothetical protein [Daejeonella sp.]OYZ33471.1 MAG: hypothetical protein B7Y24_03925 [Sphingobacteriales bacterium 16-39-50]OZA24514.1 MAG: hypothetical protein B7X86_08910 [Sphingobacteriales bacterium 17-39-43]HQS06732.1 hypothetical protein [Daejeonella sp.]HQS51775.1 hypothetical protein [Daejeonella sp.]HQT24226.1 hypothetical protein [Daejeonella sp.]